MIIAGSIGSDKTEILIKKYAELLNSNIPASKILVLLQNSNLKDKFIEKTIEQLKIDATEKFEVHSFFGLVYNTIIDNWAFLENRNTSNNTVILPNLAGLEISQYLLKEIIDEIKFKGYNSKHSLLHQLFRRYALIVQNNLTDKEIAERSKILAEPFADEAQTALKKFLKRTLELRDFDYLRQTLLFNYIYQNSDYFSKIEYLILDDGDEITPVCFDFIKYLKPQLKDVFIAFDKNGASRLGYLSADKNAACKFEETFNQTAQTLETKTKLKHDAYTIFNNIVNNKADKLEHFLIQSPSKRATMIELAIQKIKEVGKYDIKPNEISVITPIIDDMLKFTLKEHLNCNLKILSGNEKLINNKFVKLALTLLKINSDLKSTLTEFDIRVILSDFLGIPVKYCREILLIFEKTKILPLYDFEDEIFNEKYNGLLKLIKQLQNSNAKLSEQVLKIFEYIPDFKNSSKDEIIKFNFFIKQLREFETIFGNEFENRKTEIITQIENSIISENPNSKLQIEENDLIISTPQKIIDNQIQTKYQIWLDISSDEWIKSDTGPLYNAWVFQKGWDKDSYTIDDNVRLSKDKTARILRKLTLCATEKIYTFSSLFDGNGVENFGGIEKYVNFEEETTEEKFVKPIIPRPDQAPVLEYNSGSMAISAVPGAGKTFILLALVLKLLNKNVNPEHIFVLTYMESAARNFRERIKNIRQTSTKMPNISTIHGLALRILKENGNYERLGLPADFEICDDTQRLDLIRNIAQIIKLKQKETDEFDRAISVYKLSEGNLNNNNPKLKKFEEFYTLYQENLKSHNMIDYDDMLLSSVKLLRENKDILKYYQEVCEYIIEDEAQDSSAIQQELINYLSGKHKNLIRCGDINQAITTTFSNADVEGFRKFINNNTNVSMDCSQRCTKDVWELANTLVKYAKTKPEMQDAFYEMYMHPVEGKNPTSTNAVQSKIFETPQQERNYILKTIKNELTNNKKATVGILLRYNFQVGQWLDYVNDCGLKSITRSDSLSQKTIFKVIFAIFKMILNPFDNNIIADNYQILSECGFYNPRLTLEIRNYQKPFIEMNCDDIENTTLSKFYWDLNYWLSMPNLQAEELVIKIGLYYFTSEIEKSNVYLISTLVKRLSFSNNNLVSIAERLGELSKKASLSGFKFFSQEDEEDKEFLEGKVQIMTMHKSKGDEFDLVCIPELSEKNLSLTLDEIKLKSSDFMEDVRRTSNNYQPKNEYDLKKEILEENLRLLYVAITRAKKKLVMSTSSKTNSYGKTIDSKPSIIFDEIIRGEYVLQS